MKDIWASGDVGPFWVTIYDDVDECCRITADLCDRRKLDVKLPPHTTLEEAKQYVVDWAAGFCENWLEAIAKNGAQHVTLLQGETQEPVR